MGKAANGMGNIRKRADGRWEGRYTDTIGVQRSVYAKTKSDCAAKLRAKQCEVDTSSYVVPNASGCAYGSMSIAVTCARLR